MKFEIISELNEKQSVHYYCILTQNHRYDLSITYSNYFLGKAMVTSLQSGRMVLLCTDDISIEQNWAKALDIEEDDIQEFQDFFKMVLQSSALQEQY